MHAVRPSYLDLDLLFGEYPVKLFPDQAQNTVEYGNKTSSDFAPTYIVRMKSISEFGGFTLRVEDSFPLVLVQERDSAPKLSEL